MEAILLRKGSPAGGLVRHVAALTALRERSGAERQFAVRRAAGAVGAEGPFRIGGLLVDVGDGLAVLQHRQMHGVAGAAQLGAQHILIVRRIDAHVVGHRLGLGILERTVELVGLADQEAAGEGLGEVFEPRIERFLALFDAFVLRVAGDFLGVLLAQHHVMAGGAGNAVARQRAIRRVRGRRIAGRIRHRADVGARKFGAHVVLFGGCRCRTGADRECRGSRGRCPG